VALSPDGRRLVYGYGILRVEGESMAQEFYLVDLDDPRVRVTLLVPQRQQGFSQVVWSPDGQWLATNAGDGPETNINIVHVEDVSSWRQLTENAAQNFAPQWQPRP
jgi:Tol biopolymer transport system component